MDEVELRRFYEESKKANELKALELELMIKINNHKLTYDVRTEFINAIEYIMKRK